jgi:M6 family metalloprotease-like protein
VRNNVARVCLSALFIVCLSSVSEAKNQIGLGKKCNQIGKIANLKSGKLICTKSNKGSRWVILNSRLQEVLPVQPTPKPIDLSLDTRITSTQGLSDLEICKTGDLTPMSAGNNGFPRPQSVVQKPKVKILVLPIIFNEIPFTDNDLSKLNRALSETASTYSRVSMGRFTIEFEVAGRSNWVKMEKSASQYRITPSGPQQNNSIIAADAIALASSGIDFNVYDGVLIESGYSKLTRVGQAMIGETFSSRNGSSAKRVTMQLGEIAGSAPTITHELGHSLFALEDLFLFSYTGGPSATEPFPAGNWDFMSLGSDKFFGWNKLLMGWLKDEEIRCIQSQKEATHYLVEVDSEIGTKLVLINLAYGKTIALEVRTIRGYSGLHLIAYKIDSSINHGYGPISAKLISNLGINTFNEITIDLIAKSDNGILFTVTK